MGRAMSETPDYARIVDELVQLLTVERAATDIYIGSPQKGGVGRVFGGQVIAQALQAAQASVTKSKSAHSLHAYFLRGGREGAPIEYRIERDFDGRSFSNRRVVASQENEDGTATPILNLTASFQTPEEGLEHLDSPMPEVGDPDSLKPDMEVRRAMIEMMGDRVSDTQRAIALRPRPIEMRTTDKLHWMNSEPKEPRAHSWFKAASTLPDDPALHRAVIAYASDYTLLGTSALPHGLSWMRGELAGASLDHTLWFHQDACADDWLLYATDSPWSGAGRGFNQGRIFKRDGTLVASAAQEGMVRKRIKKRS